MNKAKERLLNGLIKENPTFVLMLGMCPTLAVTTSAINGLGMGLTTTVVLVMSNIIISLLRNIIPAKVRIPAFIVIIASFVTIIELLLEGFIPALYDALGIYIPLIVVNCIILGRAESYASKNPPIPSLFDGLGMGLGFTFALTCIGIIRELLGAGKIFDAQILPLADSAKGIAGFTPIAIFVLAPGAFFVLAILTAIQNQVSISAAKKGKVSKVKATCNSDCSSCTSDCGDRKFYDASATGTISGKTKLEDANTKIDNTKIEDTNTKIDNPIEETNIKINNPIAEETNIKIGDANNTKAEIKNEKAQDIVAEEMKREGKEE